MCETNSKGLKMQWINKNGILIEETKVEMVVVCGNEY